MGQPSSIASLMFCLTYIVLELLTFFMLREKREREREKDRKRILHISISVT